MSGHFFYMTCLTILPVFLTWNGREFFHSW